MRIRSIVVGAGVALGLTAAASAQNLSEGFESVAALPGMGWAFQNNSQSPSNPYFQGNPVTFPAHAGTPASYLAANFLSTGQAVGDISNWAMAPARVWNNGDMVSFYTRAVVSNFPDRLEVRLSTDGASTDVGADHTTVGDFTTLLATVNPSLVVGGYPTQWTQVQIMISGLGGPMLGRLGFRYFVPFSGAAGVNGDYIGIDSLDIRGGTPVVPLPSAGALGLAGIGLIATRRRRLV